MKSSLRSSLLFFCFVVVSAAGCGKTDGDNSISSQDSNASYNKQEGERFSEETLSVRFVEEKKEMTDPDAPVGYWEIDKRYPEVVGKTTGASKVNRAIKGLVDTYSCETVGDETFRSVITYSTKNALSFTYEAMWMCANMPGPDSTVGAMTLELKNAAPVQLRSYFLTPETYAKFVKLAQAKSETSCPDFVLGEELYLHEKGIGFLIGGKNHDTPICDQEVLIEWSVAKKYLKPESILMLSEVG